MKNKYNLLIVLAVMIFVIGCSCGSLTGLTGSKDTSTEKKTDKTTDSTTEKTTTDRVIEEIADGETSGVPECDDLMKFINEQSKSPDDNWVTKGVKDYIISQIKKSLKESLEKNKDDKVKLADQCKDLREKLTNQLQAEKEKKGQ